MLIIWLDAHLFTDIFNTLNSTYIYHKQPTNPQHHRAAGNLRRLKTSTRKVLAVRVVAADGAYNYTEAKLSDKVFGTDGDPVNLKSQTAACSYDQLQFVATPDRNITNDHDPEDQTTGIVNGVMTVEIANLVNEKSIDAELERAITTKINEVFGVNSPKDIAEHVMYCLPYRPFSITAKAYVGHWLSVFNNEYCNFVSVQMHEVSFNELFHCTLIISFIGCNTLSHTYIKILTART